MRQALSVIPLGPALMPSAATASSPSSHTPNSSSLLPMSLELRSSSLARTVTAGIELPHVCVPAVAGNELPLPAHH